MITFTNGELNLPIWIIVIVLILPSVVSLITVALSFLSTIIQSNQKNKLEKFNTVYMQKLKIIQDFARAYGNLSKDTFGEFVGCAYAAMAIADEETQKLLQLMLSNFITGDEEKSGSSFARCTKIVVSLTDLINK